MIHKQSLMKFQMNSKKLKDEKKEPELTEKEKRI